MQSPQHDRWNRVFSILKEKSTITGLVGLAVLIANQLGYVEVDETMLGEVVLAVVSIVAIATRPQPPRHRQPPITQEYPQATPKPSSPPPPTQQNTHEDSV